VRCSQTSNPLHQGHAPSSDYFDVPRLLAGANQTALLRGKHGLIDVERYLEDHDSRSLAVYISYDCEAYHKELKNSFRHLPMPDMEVSIRKLVNPFFAVLQSDGKPATPISEAIILSKGLEEAINELHRSHSIV
jgi:hypothetical protein